MTSSPDGYMEFQKDVANAVSIMREFVKMDRQGRMAQIMSVLPPRMKRTLKHWQFLLEEQGISGTKGYLIDKKLYVLILYLLSLIHI